MSANRPDHAELLKRSLLAIDQLEAKLAAAEAARREPIAIVGIGCRSPGDANDPESFWKLMLNGVDAVTEVPADRWDMERYFDPDPDAVGKTYTRWGAFLRNVDQFDAAFFGISRREAQNVDPQQRLLLECSWEALEHAGISPASLMGTQASVFVGISTHDYSLRVNNTGKGHLGDAYIATGTAHSVASGRVSYVLGLTGPNAPVDTACSSSLVAAHLAVQSLRNREANLALVGGVNLTLIPDGSILTARGRMMSATGRCKTFDASADGYVRAEGCGVIVLKRLSDAKRDGDSIIAVIRGTAINQDGRTSGLTAPNGPSQERVIKAALSNAGLAPDDIGYIEAHGTGTSLGDPIEMQALGAVFGARSPKTPLMVGSVKTNIGHAEAAAGIFGLIKAALVLQRRTIPVHLHLRKPNPLIAWDRYPITVPTQQTAWDSGDKPRRAGVSSFGFSGTNAHVVLEEAPPEQPAPAKPETPQLLVLSAETPTALQQLAQRFESVLTEPDAPALSDIARTCVVGRSHFAERAAIFATDIADARKKLTAVAAGEAGPGIARGRVAGSTAPEIAFVFTGQGAQYPSMAMRLMESQPVFKQAMEECARRLEPHLPKPLLSVIRGTDGLDGLIDDTRYTQPALFAVEYSLAQLWRSWGVEPAVVMGHSVGEYVAAVVAGVFSLEDGLRLISTRARLMSELPRDGGMAAIFADEGRVREALRGHEANVAIAAVNGPKAVVISGRTEAVGAVMEALRAAGIESQRLNVSHAFHSMLMDPMLDELEAAARSIKFSPARIGVVSNLTGALAGEEIGTPSYWRRHVREAVRFADSVETLRREGYRVMLEAGPQPTLLGMAQRCPGGAKMTLIGSLRKGRDDDAMMFEALGQLYVNGVLPDARGVWGDGATRNRVRLPTYPFQRERYWLDVDSSNSGPALEKIRNAHPLLSGALPAPLPMYQQEIGTGLQPWLADHRIAGYVLFPATAYLELALAVARETFGSSQCVVRDLRLSEAMVVPETGSLTVQAIVTASTGATRTVQIFSRSQDEAWHLNATASIEQDAGVPAVPGDRQELARRIHDPVDLTAYYETLVSRGADYGPAFRGLVELTSAPAEALGHVRLPAAAGGAKGYLVHPALLDSSFQVIGAALARVDGIGDPTGYLPAGVSRYRVLRPGVEEVWCHVTATPAGASGSLTCDLVLLAADGAPVAEVTGLELRKLSSAGTQRSRATKRDPAEWAFETSWELAQDDPQAAAAVAGKWLVLGEAGGLGTAVARDLRAAGADVRLVTSTELDPRDRAQTERLVSEGGQLAGVVCLWPLEAKRSSSITKDCDATTAPVLALAQALASSSTRLWLVTRGAQPVMQSIPDPVQAAAWGLGGVVASELPALRTVRVDLDPVASPTEAAALARVLRSQESEARVALRGNARLVARLAPAEVQPSREDPLLRLDITERGSLSNLALTPYELPAPGPGEVEIRVHATGLNFRDVLNALGMYPGDPGPLGNECAGVITAVGPGVTGLAVGDEVISMPARAFATRVIAPAVLTVPKPRSLTFAEAATIPVTFLTAEYALRHLGGMKRGDRVLIHSVAGGVGMAATQIARRAGAEIFGTAGSPAKRALARSLGVHHVADSRSVSFAADVMRDSGGKGVDIVLNSLAGDFIPASLGTLAPGGRFVEIGKTGIWNEAKVAAEYPGVQYHAFYLGELAASRPELVRQMLLDLLADFEKGVLQPLPLRQFTLEKAEAGFRFMAQGLHTGKVVITRVPPPLIRADGTYLVTGGLGGLGLLCARWLVQQGGRNLVLTGRRAPSDEARAVIAGLEAEGAKVRVAQADVSNLGDVRKLLADIESLRGVLHAAGVIDDAMLPEQSTQRFEKVMGPKVQGAWNLHELTAGLPLDFFVLFSSAAALLGSPGQANYASANSVLDALASVRKARGLPALSVQWGGWAEVGMAAGLDDAHHRRSSEMGFPPIEPAEGIRMLDDLLFGSHSAQVAALPLVRSRLSRDLGSFFRGIAGSTKAGASSDDGDILQRLTAAPEQTRAAELTTFLNGQLVKVLALGAGYQIDAHRSVMALGLDSLMAMELRNRLQTTLGVAVPVTDLLAGPSVAELTQQLLAALPGLAPAETAEVETETETETWEVGTL